MEAMSLVDRASKEIIQLILENDMQPGEKLPNEVELSKRLKVGRGTVREAVRKLTVRNILEVRQGSGIYVSKKKGIPEDPLGLTLLKKDYKLALDLIEMRLLIEPDVAERAALCVNAAKKKEMERLCGALSDTINRKEDYRRDDVALHSYIAECSNNSVMKNMVSIIATSVSVSIRASNNGLLERAEEEHWNIVRAICRNDHLGARYAMIVHLNTTRSYFAELLQSDGLRDHSQDDPNDDAQYSFVWNFGDK